MLTLLLVGMALALAACGARELRGSPAPSATLRPTAPAPTAPASPTTPPAPGEVVITLPPATPAATLSVGQMIRLIPPQNAAGWNISYADDILTMLTTADQIDQPGAAGWQLRAASPGQTDVMVSSRPAPCPNSRPCSPPVIQFTFSVIVQS